MIVLLDTHTLLWFLLGDPQLSTRARQLVEDEQNVVLVSVASLWEMAIKTTRGRLTLMGGFERFVKEQILGASELQVLNVRAEHTMALSRIPLATHKDPFDRLLVAQAVVERAHLVSKDSKLAEYAPLLVAVGANIVW